MKILQIIPYFSPKRGGEVNVCLHLSRCLIERGHEVTVLTTDFELDQNRVKDVERLGVKLVVFPCSANISLFLVSPQLAGWLSENIRRYDIVHLHGLRSYQNVQASRWARRTGTPYILQAHGSVVPFLRRIALKKAYDLVWGKQVLRRASRVIAITQREACEYKEMGVLEERIRFIPNGIDSSAFAGRQRQGQFKSRFSIADDEKIVLYIGRLHESKGLDLLLSAFKEVANEVEGARLVVVGPDDGYLAHLRKTARTLRLSDKVLFTGFLSDDEIRSALLDAQVFVTPMFRGFPITFLEASASGVPIVTSTSGDELNWIDRKAGLVVGYDSTQMGDAIVEILQNDALRREFGGHGMEIVKANFDWRIITQQVERLYEETVALGTSSYRPSKDTWTKARTTRENHANRFEYAEGEGALGDYAPHGSLKSQEALVMNIIPKIRVHARINNRLWGSKGYRIVTSLDDGQSWERHATLPVSSFKNLLSHSRIASRLFRLGVHKILRLSDEVVLVACGKSFFVANTNQDVVVRSELKVRGFQVLDRSICKTPNTLFYGEYFPNMRRHPVKIFSSADGVNWELVFLFRRKEIRHVHLIQFDPFSKRIWFSTGDSDSEVMLGHSDESFNDVKIVGGGSQIWRSLELILEQNKVYWGTDIPRSPNWLISYDRQSERIEKLHEFPGPIYNLRRIGEHYLVATAAEEHADSSRNSARIWCSRDIERGQWKEVLRGKKDSWPVIFGFGRLMLGADSEDSFYVWESALKSADDRSLKIRAPLLPTETR